ncbi:MAG: CCA tRNA nucleotidyltransferase, partial [Bacteroidales bacterium]|nr:CCA tRNA nucleotidyltransferase [Bacteroidales bacterium]
MKDQFKDHLALPVFRTLSEAAGEFGKPVYAVGGYVRDIILGRHSQDLDVVAVGSGIELAQIFARKIGPRARVNVFKTYGTAMVKYFDGQEWIVEFVGARKESYSMDSRKPAVESGTLKNDQDRRDFTINTLAISLNKEDYGKLIDPFDGLQDLKNGLIRTPLDPDITYSDDPLRMMRAIRFATQLQFAIEKGSFEAISRNAGRIGIVSRERINTELEKIMMAPRPSVGFHLLMDSGLLQLIFPELADLKGATYIEGKGHKDNFSHTLQVLDNVAAKLENLWLRWGALLHDIAKP